MYPRLGFWYQGNIRMRLRSLVLVPGNIRMYLCSVFLVPGTSAQTTLLETTFCESPIVLASFLSEVIQEPLPLRPRILVKKSLVLVKRKNGFTKTVPWTENPGKIRTGAF